MVEKEVSRILDDMTAAFHKNPDGVEVGFRELCADWPWAKRSDAYTHLLHRYPAKMLSYIPAFFLSTQRYASRGDPILDVFAGTATVLLESIIHPFLPRSAYGIEINPLARLIAKVKTTLIDPDYAWQAAKKVTFEVQNTSECQLPDYDNLDYWFPHQVQQNLGTLAWSIDKADIDDDIRDFLLVCLSSIVRKCSYADPHIPVPVRLKIDESAPNSPRAEFIKKWLDSVEKADPSSIFLDIVYKNVLRMRKLAQVKAVADHRVEARIIGDDARQIQYVPMGARAKLYKEQAQEIPDECISLVITSPPYGSAQKYTRTTRLEMLWLGLADVKDLEELDKASIGTERVSHKEYNELVQTGYGEIDTTLEQVYQKSHYRAGLVSSYFREMIKVLNEIKRVLISNGTLILVVGNNTATGIPIPNHKFLTLIAENIGFNKELLLRDPVRSRGMITKRHATAGMITDDWVLVLRKGS